MSSVFPFVAAQSSDQVNMEDLPMFREYAYDFENNCLLLQNGSTYLVEGNAALRIWIMKALFTERSRYTAYDSDFGSEVHTLVGSKINSSVILSELKRFVVEALMCNPYIQELSNFKFTQSGSGVTVEFDCATIYGSEEIVWEAKELTA